MRGRLLAGRVRPAFETAVLLASVVALLLPIQAALAALAALILLWIAARPPRQERVFVSAALTLAGGLIFASILAGRPVELSDEKWSTAVRSNYLELWGDLRAAAQQTAGSFEQPPDRSSDHRAEFGTLEAFAAAAEAGTTLLLISPEGRTEAWAGQGLLHDFSWSASPESGFAYQRGYTAVTLFAVEPLSADRRPWWVVAGRSLPTDRLPFEIAARLGGEQLRWTVGPHDAPEIAGTWRLDFGDGLPSIFLSRSNADGDRPRAPARLLYRLGVGLLGLTLLALALLRTAGDRLLPEGSGRFGPHPPGLPLLTVAGTVALGVAAQFQRPLTVALALAMGLATWGLMRPRRFRARLGANELLGGSFLVGLAVAAYSYQRWTGPEDLAGSFVGSADSFALCLVWCLAALGLLTLAAPRGGVSPGDRWAWWAALLLMAGGAACDLPWLAVPLLAFAGAAIVRWLAGLELSERPAALAGLLVLASLAGSVSWEIAYREVFRESLAEDFLPLLEPPSSEELNDLHVEIFDHFENLDIDRLRAPLAGSVDSRDLAFVLWRDSPLPRRDALSALAVETSRGERSTFSFGLSLNDDLKLELPPDQWNVPPVPAWNESLIFGRVAIRLDGIVWGSVSFWFLPRPGFRLEVDEIGELDEALLRGGVHDRVLDGLPRGVHYGLYDSTGRAISSPWEESPPVDLSLLDASSDVDSMETPIGRAWVWRRDAADGVEILYLPRLTPRAGLERVGIHALGSLAWITAIALVALGLALPRKALKDLFERTVRSYSKRMILVYALLLLVPLVALNLVLMQSFADRQRQEQRTQAQSALASGRLMLVSYLQGLELGFDLHTKVNRELLEGIASVVEHPVNVYWGSRFFASSQQELFTAGLLPRRIPGEIYSRLALSDYKMGFRQNRGEPEYLELYAPLNLEGIDLFLSVPVLEQERDVARELAALRRRAVLVTSALVLLLVAVGSRLARGFTNPIMELIGGTRRIAAGAPFLEVTPREHELEALADAIDDMARRVAESRRKLVLEKQVVERMVENITSGVVSLDHDRRVLLQNRVAADLLGTEIGAEIEQALADEVRLAPVLDFLSDGRAASAQATLALRDEAGEEREWTLTWVPIPGPEDPAALLVVDDATEVLRGQRLEAWAEMARIIAHEIKNPLTPIRLSADHMRQVYRADRERFDDVFERCTTNILKQVDELTDIASDFSIYSRIPQAELVPGDLVTALRELVDGYHAAAGNGSAIGFASESSEVQARFDPKLLGRAVRNVLENALRASEGRGGVDLTIDAEGESARIRVVDSGPGVEEDLLRRIFEPYFSTYDSGTGLGLAITRQIVEEHGGHIEASNRAGGGLRVTITIPLAEDGMKQQSATEEAGSD
ncbi:MAG: PAS domain-containing protein [bacterium]|nr:PAS domain-containing protein [bacterium]